MVKSTDISNDDPKKKKTTKVTIKKDAKPTPSSVAKKTSNKSKTKSKKSDVLSLEEGEILDNKISLPEEINITTTVAADEYSDTSQFINDLDTNPRDVFETEMDTEFLRKMAGANQMWLNWAHFELSFISPQIDEAFPPTMIAPEDVGSSDEKEFVYPICDYGNKLSTSKATDMYSVGMSMCKLFYTIEKMIFILIERLKEIGTDTETEVQISFDGHLLAQRKAFESVINLNYNVVVVNFDPGVWGEHYLAIVKRLADKGYGYPSETPRDVYRSVGRSTPGVKR